MALRISRRALLRSAGGAAIALPALDIMSNRRGAAYAQSSQLPKRFIVCFGGQSLGGDGDPLHNDYVPNTVGRNYDLKSALAPLAPVQAEVSVVSGLAIPTANGGAVPAAGRRDDFHVSSLSPLLSGVRSPDNTAAAGPTSDQIVAAQIAGNTPFRSLVYRIQAEWYLSVSAPYGRDILSYKGNPSGGNPIPVAPVVSPRAAFDSLFTNFTPPNDAAAAAKQDFLLRSRKSVLDLVSGRLQTLIANPGLGTADHQRLQRHFDEVRDLERQIYGGTTDDGNLPETVRPRRGSVDRWGAGRGCRRQQHLRSESGLQRRGTTREDLLRSGAHGNHLRSFARRLRHVHDVPVAHEHVSDDRPELRPARNRSQRRSE